MPDHNGECRTYGARFGLGLLPRPSGLGCIWRAGPTGLENPGEPEQDWAMIDSPVLIQLLLRLCRHASGLEVPHLRRSIHLRAGTQP